MNHYGARVLQIERGPDDIMSIFGAQWHYTVRNSRGGTYPVGYCREHDGHPTADEARRCFRRYLLDGAHEESYAGWRGCEVCDEPTKQGMTTRPPFDLGHALCDEHRTPGELAGLTPVPGQIMASY